MIGKLRGKVDSVDGDSVILDVMGVGYLVFASARTLSSVQDTTKEISLIIETHVREDHIHLYGFLTQVERDWFRLLMTVQGVGAKMALAIMAVAAPDELATIIAAEDKVTLTRANGVGKKLSERIVNELKTKVPAMTVGHSAVTEFGKAVKGKKAAPAKADIREDAVSALVNLGYNRMNAFTAVARAMQEEGAADFDELIRLSLKELAA